MFKEQKIKLFIIMSWLFNYSLTNDSVQVVSNPIEIKENIPAPVTIIKTPEAKTIPIKEFVSINKEFLIKDYFLKQMNIVNLIYLGCAAIYGIRFLINYNETDFDNEEKFTEVIVLGIILWLFKVIKFYKIPKYNFYFWPYYIINTIIFWAISIIIFIEDPKTKAQGMFFGFSALGLFFYALLDILINSILLQCNSYFNLSKDELNFIEIDTNKMNEIKDININKTPIIKEDVDKNTENKPIETKIDNNINKTPIIKEDADKNKENKPIETKIDNNINKTPTIKEDADKNKENKPIETKIDNKNININKTPIIKQNNDKIKQNVNKNKK